MLDLRGSRGKSRRPWSSVLIAPLKLLIASTTIHLSSDDNSTLVA